MTEAAQTIPEVLEAAVARAPGKQWLQHGDSTFTYEEAFDRVVAIAHALSARGIGREARVMVTTRNSPEYVFTWLALMWLGAVMLPVNPRSAPAELSGLAGQFGPRLFVTDTGLFEVVSKSVQGSRLATVEELNASPPAQPSPPAAKPDDIAVMIPTSGTTGRSKLVMQTQRAYALAAEGFPFWLELTSEDRLMTSLPLFHMNAHTYSVLGSIAATAGLVLLPRFSASRFIDQARRYGATEFNAIGAMLEILMRQPARPDDAENPLRLCLTGPSPSKARQLEIEKRFGFEVRCGYALSESPYGLIWKRGTRPFGTLGSPRQHPILGEINHARVRDEGREVEPGGTGELELKNPAVMVGYYDMPEETEEVLRDGWLRTGDLVTVGSDGNYTFVGRKKEIIRRRGENLSPVEVEQALEKHPAIVEAAVVGVPSELSDEEVKAFLVLVDDAEVVLEEVRDFVGTHVAPFKIPRYFEIVERLPHTPTGRIAKHRLPLERTSDEHDLDPHEGSGRGRR